MCVFMMLLLLRMQFPQSTRSTSDERELKLRIA